MSRNAIHGWLLLLPALAFLALFTHWPVLGTIWDSFHATAKGGRPAPWVGLENYQVMLSDEVFWQSLRNNLWYAAGTIPVSIALAMLMALWVNSKMIGRTWLRMAFFTPTGVRAGIAAGMRVFGYVGGPQSTAAELGALGATTFASMRELPALLGGRPEHADRGRALEQRGQQVAARPRRVVQRHALAGEQQ